VTVEAAGRPTRALGWRFDPAGPPHDRDPEPLDAEGRARLEETLSEVMGLFGRRTAAEMPALLPGIAVRALARARGAATATSAALSEAPGAEAVELSERVYPYARFFAVEEHRLRHPRFDGGMSAPVERAVFASGDAVTVLPFDPHAGTVLLIEQFRAGPWARRDPRPWMLETIAGRSDRAEPPEATARREAGEEAGLTLGRLERIGGYYPSPGIASEYIVGFVGEADLGGAGDTTHGLAEEQEDIRTLVVTLEGAMEAFAAGEIRNAPLIVSLLWLDRHAARLRLAWA
jgi:nudix-type nucleoside diphosphatase (YffH/AdpP family)